MKIGRAGLSGEASARNSVLHSAQDIEASPVGSKGWSRKGCRLVNAPGEALIPAPFPSPPKGGEGRGEGTLSVSGTVPARDAHHPSSLANITLAGDTPSP